MDLKGMGEQKMDRVEVAQNKKWRTVKHVVMKVRFYKQLEIS
jgi:hypothetical protein